MDKYFAASNSAKGFVNYYKQCFLRAEKIFIVQGGPGTGKSRFMHRVGQWAEEKGYGVEYYLCSSDPDSIDGVLIEKEGKYTGLLDGTSPHTFEPEIIGVREQYINLGNFWDRNKLESEKKKIADLSKNKQTCFENAYRYLMACGNLKVVKDSYLKPHIDLSLMKASAERLVSRFDKDEGFEAIPALIHALGMKGRVYLDTFYAKADVRYFISSAYGCESIYMQYIFEALKERDVFMRVSYDPIYTDVIDGIYLPQSKITFLYSKDDIQKKGGRYINTRRYLTLDPEESLIEELKYIQKLRVLCEHGALSELSKAKDYHFALEKIYSNAMNFENVNNFTDSFLQDFCI